MLVARWVPIAIAGSLFLASCSAENACWPAAADTFDGNTNEGCEPKPTFESCEVPNGSIVGPNGQVLTPDGGTVTCTDLCSPTEYSLACSGSETIAAPASALHCTILVVDTLSNAFFYCCPCSR